MDIREELKKIKKEMKKHKASRDKWYELSFKADKLHEKIKKEDERKEQDEITEATNLKDCDFPSMGYASTNGSATFKNKKQAEKLCEVLSHSYYYAYIVEWEDPGDYVFIPSYSVDHDGEDIYTGTFMTQEKYNKRDKRYWE